MKLIFSVFVLALGLVSLSQEPPKLLPPSPIPQTTGDSMESSMPPSAIDGSSVSNMFIYDPTGKRDPFEPESELLKIDTSEPISSQVDSGPVKPKRNLESLEYFDLSQLKVSAIIWNTKKPRAMILDPNGVMHTVRLRTRIGQRNGFVVAIREGEVLVVEYVQQNGTWTKTFNVLNLR
jgi:type IV pilus assembly protein PilP